MLILVSKNESVQSESNSVIYDRLSYLMLDECGTNQGFDFSIISSLAQLSIIISVAALYVCCECLESGLVKSSMSFKSMGLKMIYYV